MATLWHLWAVACPKRLAGHALRPQAAEPLGQFLDYCTYGHMIDNVVLIVTGTLHERDVQVRGHLRRREGCAGVRAGLWAAVVGGGVGEEWGNLEAGVERELLRHAVVCHGDSK
jgi:hypothetical protein